MLSLTSSVSPFSSTSSIRCLHPRFRSYLFFINPRTNYTRVCRGIRAYSGNHIDPISVEFRKSYHEGVTLKKVVNNESNTIRLDSWKCSQVSGISRARIQSSIRSRLVSINGGVVKKASHMVRPGDEVNCTIPEVKPLQAIAEDISLDIIYEDDHVLVVNKPVHMVVHPAPGNSTGTLVNAILNHCSLPDISYRNRELLSNTEGIFDDEFSGLSTDQEGIDSDTSTASIRPGIVHRLDKGTTGLLVVAKNEHSHAHLYQQFQQRTIHRVYVSLTCGVPSLVSGCVNVPIGRDLNRRIRMTTYTGINNSLRARSAVSRYRNAETLAGGGAALVEWKLETGRTHQIRAHAKYLGIPLLGDDVYGCTKNMAMDVIGTNILPCCYDILFQMVTKLERPCLHAVSLGFDHPDTGKQLMFSCRPPEDFTEILCQLRKIFKKLS